MRVRVQAPNHRVSAPPGVISEVVHRSHTRAPCAFASLQEHPSLAPMYADGLQPLLRHRCAHRSSNLREQQHSMRRDEAARGVRYRRPADDSAARPQPLSSATDSFKEVLGMAERPGLEASALDHSWLLFHQDPLDAIGRHQPETMNTMQHNLHARISKEHVSVGNVHGWTKAGMCVRWQMDSRISSLADVPARGPSCNVCHGFNAYEG